MKTHQRKSSVNTEMGISMLTANRMSVFKTPQCRRSSYLYAVASICSVHHNLWVRGSIPFPDKIGIAQLDRATETCGFDSHSRRRRDGETGKRKALRMLLTEVHHFLKNGDALKQKLRCLLFVKVLQLLQRANSVNALQMTKLAGSK